MCDWSKGIEMYNSVGSVDEPLAVTGRMLAQVDRAGGVGGAEPHSVWGDACALTLWSSHQAATFALHNNVTTPSPHHHHYRSPL